jgi:type I restriction enzyme M protein
MITGDLKSKVDKLWTTFWNNGISNPLSVIEQISYLSKPSAAQRVAHTPST